jgi:hypothetical protein
LFPRGWEAFDVGTHCFFASVSRIRATLFLVAYKNVANFRQRLPKRLLGQALE